MPIAAQPDPATYRKPKKPTASAEAFNPYAHQQEIYSSIEYPSAIGNKQSINNIMLHKMDSEGDVNFSPANLDEMLEKIEADELVKKSRSGGDIIKISKFLKPRVPASVKAKEKKAQKAQKQSRDDSVEKQYNIAQPTKPKIQEVSADSLDRLLNQLKKCELAMTCPHGETPIQTEKNKQQKGYERAIEISTDDEVRRQRDETNQVISNKSFNYKDIATQMLRFQSEVRAYCGSASDFSNNMSRDIKETHSTGSAKRSVPKVPPLDDMCALELHRSKSYIVNLIDRALSKELGTVPNERSRREVFETMNPRKAIETVNRHAACARSQKDISLEITSALTESILSNATAPPGDSDSRTASSSASAKTCCCGAEEPNYIKQLKQLRWGHLKHIQREVHRLEELERFLDSCSITTIPES
nr:unnamed protein product [Callosobruchus chinensis]